MVVNASYFGALVGWRTDRCWRRIRHRAVHLYLILSYGIKGKIDVGHPRYGGRLPSFVFDF